VLRGCVRQSVRPNVQQLVPLAGRTPPLSATPAQSETNGTARLVSPVLRVNLSLTHQVVLTVLQLK
jgi:hypothetical protein